MNEILKLLEERRSVRAYRKEQITDAQLEAILRAGIWAPSAKNQQSPVVVVVQDPETVAELSRLNAQVMGAQTDPFYGAPTVLVVLADPKATNEINAAYDGALVMGNLMNAAWSLGVGSCWINRAREVFQLPEGKALLTKWGLPEDLVGVGNCILGYPEGETLQPKERRPGRIVRV